MGYMMRKRQKKSNRRIESKRAVIGKNIISVILVIYTFLSIFLIGNTILSSLRQNRI